MKYYILGCDSPSYGGYPAIKLEYLDEKLKSMCFNSAFSKIDPNPEMTLYVSKNKDDEYADFMFDYSTAIPLVSNRFKEILDNFGVSNILYKKISLKPIPKGEVYECWLALPSRIDCLDYDKSEYDDGFYSYTKIVIDENKAKNYDIFKISRQDNRGAIGCKIFVSERFKDYITKWEIENETKLTCLYFEDLDNY